MTASRKSARAEETESPKNRLGPVAKTPETEALRRFFPEGRGIVEGYIVRGFLAPGSPELREEGTVKIKWVMDGLVCMFSWDEWTFSGDKRVSPMRGCAMVGWDSRDKEYRMLKAANTGVMHQLDGKLEGNRMTFVSREAMIEGRPTRTRHTLFRESDEVIDWIAETSVGRGPWRMVSVSTITYSGV